MGVIDLFWFFLMLSALQPMLRQRMLEYSRQRMLARIQSQRRSRVILLVHRQETLSLLGFPLMRYIDINDSEEVIRAINMTDDDTPIDLVLHTPGGLVLASLQIARALKHHKGKVTVYVPHYAMSGGTMIALAADEIVMSRHAVLGPVDPQLGQHAAASILRVVKDKPIERIDDETLIRADQAEKAITQVETAARGLLQGRLAPEEAGEIARALTGGQWTHDHPLGIDDVRALGLAVSDQMPQEIMDLIALYPQPVRRTPSVEYLPIPMRKNREEGASGWHSG